MNQDYEFHEICFDENEKASFNYMGMEKLTNSPDLTDPGTVNPLILPIAEDPLR